MKWLLPPVLVAILLLAMLAIGFIAPVAQILPPPLHFLGLVVIAGGVALGAAGSFRFFRIGTEINTFREPRKLVTDGVFAYSRNPMYLGFLFVLAGAALIINSVVNIALVAVFLLVANGWYIPFEEANAQRIFGQPYMDYCKRVRRWV